MLSFLTKKSIIVTLAILLIFLMTASTVSFMRNYTAPGPLAEKKVIWIEKGQELSSISQQLHNEGILTHPLWYELHLRLRGLSGKIRAGEFEIEPHMSPAEIAHILIQGAFIQHAFTLPEGLHSKDAIDLLSQVQELDKSQWPTIKEGDLLPETYYFIRNESASNLIERMKKSMQETLSHAWKQHRADHVLKSQEELLILASIVEKEAGLDAERPTIAAVFLNRLKIGMPLQSDPTVLYGLMIEHQIQKQALSKADLKLTSTYNTYLIAGLPPTPICNPGKASIEAVMNPAETKALYFVADGTGGHVFSNTYEEHKKNHENWRKIRDKS